MDLEKLEYIVRPGIRNDHDIVVYALSTCGFCKRALAFLDEKGLRYRFIYVDLIPVETKNEIKTTLKARFNVNVAFPFAIIDQKQHLVGFIEPDWIRTLDA